MLGDVDDLSNAGVGDNCVSPAIESTDSFLPIDTMLSFELPRGSDRLCLVGVWLGDDFDLTI
jgi:hypothetical protein